MKTPIISNYPFASLHATEEWHLELKCTFLLRQRLWTWYGITMALDQQVTHEYDLQRLRAVGDSDPQTRICEKSRHGYPQRVTRTGYLGRLGLVDRLAGHTSPPHDNVASN